MACLKNNQRDLSYYKHQSAAGPTLVYNLVQSLGSQVKSKKEGMILTADYHRKKAISERSFWIFDFEHENGVWRYLDFSRF
ncbi:hypothetical protein L596_030526 [Steinernema carpocapsae]|uniref:Uncharacterized protein n=1 Tax=Steinernema carpocapsae TaxID=34508 RepID=A0A4U5LPM4_STECR|nr:hypothetical protein L596_030521 [Steinernema carpocapsae]TKR57882.1 hypothetical protein L596_030526 [Steinernema carpocapsae]